MNNRLNFLYPVYLIIIAILVFALPQPCVLIATIVLIAIQYLLLFVKSKISKDSLRIFDRLKFLFFFLILINSLFAEDHLAGAYLGLLMSLQILTVVLVSYTVRKVAGTAAFISGLKQLRLPTLLTYSIDATLFLLEGEPKGRGVGRKEGSVNGSGKGSGSGSGKGAGNGSGNGSGEGSGMGSGNGSGKGKHAKKGLQKKSLKDLVKLIRKDGVNIFIERIQQSFKKSKKHSESLGLDSDLAHDVGIIAGIGALMLAFKLVKVLPGIAIFSGGKAIFFFPLYFLAAEKTKSPWGATVAGTVMGIIAFLNGDGRYGIFEILKHIAPGLLIDFLWPLLRKIDLKVWAYSLLGVLLAFSRTATEFCMVILLSPDSKELYLFPAMKLIPNILAGLISGILSYQIIKYV